MYKVGLTGNYYSGQVEVSQIFEGFDVPVFNANLIVKFLINFSSPHIRKIKDTLGESSYRVGLLDLQKINNNKSFDKIFDIIEIDLFRAYEKFRLKHKDEFYTIFYFDHIFERNLKDRFDFIVSCYRPEHHRKYDMQYLTNLSDFTIQKILDNEMNPSFKNNSSDYIIQNYNTNGDYRSDIVIGLESQVKKVHKRIMSKKLESTIMNHYGLDLKDQ